MKLKSKALTVLLLVVSFLIISTTEYSNSLAPLSKSAVQDNGLWETYKAKGEEFSVQMPAVPGVLAKTTCLNNLHCKEKRDDVTYAAYADGVVFIVTSYSNPNHRQSLKEIVGERLEQFNSEGLELAPQGKATLNEFPGESYEIKSKTNNRVGINRFYLTKGHVYEISVATDDLKLSSVHKFFESFKLGTSVGKEIGSGSGKITASVAVLAAPNVTTSPDVVIGRGGGGEIIYKPSEVSSKAIVILKPSPEYTEQARQEEISGTVTLQMVFGAAGDIRQIRTISGLPFGLTEKAIAAARRIYFLPAVKDGKRVPQWIRVEYNFIQY